MAGSKSDGHVVVEIPVIGEEQQQQQKDQSLVLSAIENHPLMEISQSPGHLLLLKLWQREEDLSGRRVGIKETKLHSIRSQIFNLCSFFFLFHFFFLTILFTSSSGSASKTLGSKWWIPSLMSCSTSLVIVSLVQVELFRYWKVWRQVQGERSDARAVARCIRELRMKGARFDLFKKEAFGSGKRMKSSSVEIKWKPLTWCSRNLITIALLCFAGLMFPAPKLILCTL